METVMEAIGTASDRVLNALIAGLTLEFGHDAGEGLAQRFLDAEECDFLWDVRISERWVGGWEAESEDGIELDRVRILARLDRKWIVATLLVDGDGNPQGLLGRRDFTRRTGAEQAYLDAR